MALAGYAIRFATGFLFIVAGVSKLSDRHGLETAIRNYRVLTPSLVRPVARFLPWAELFAGAALLLGIFLGVAVLLAAGALMAFSVAIAINLGRGRKVSCGCFGPGASEQISFFMLVRNLALAVSLIIVWRSPPTTLAWYPAIASSNQSVTPNEATAMLVMGALGLAMLLGMSVFRRLTQSLKFFDFLPAGGER